ncbi:MAG TPA: aminodeoxychorismate lyase [Phycicoccus sp.]|jgi:branched-chain amino acid aminotransferase|nr:aminodeoxychorismate lyase [Phycicoccus sp.]HQK30540.1 aminodeoxychorismate lyase [Phycicoccus sp.]
MNSVPNEVRVWVNGTLIGPDTPSIAAVDHGVTVGDGVFETCKIVDGQPFAVSRHLLRMDRSLAGLGLDGADHDLIREGIDAVLGAGPSWPFGRLRWTVTGGLGPLGSDRHVSALTHIVTASPALRPPPTVSIATVPWVRNERSATAGLKTTSYAENVVALAAAQRSGANEAILANSRGELCEGTGSNIFVVMDGQVLTPPLDSGCLAGISRELVLEWGREAGLPVHERAVPLEVLATCDEVFLTSSLKDVRPVTAADGREIPVGPLTTRLAEVWEQRSLEGMDP